MNIKVIVVVLIIGILLCQIEAGRKNRKKSSDNTLEYSSSSEDKRDYKMREKKDKSSSSSEEDKKDKDERNGTAIHVVNELQRAKRSELNEQPVQQSFMRKEHDTRIGRAAIQSSNSEKQHPIPMNYRLLLFQNPFLVQSNVYSNAAL
ncbi:unnamed protein product [Onchocerca flexuosa]|uniref:Uncharacterized protein n=1 Tax=Onchocerca flexuosa TaxID=387005 RepID=A0A183GY44_9BILA|nr:unnamed protein product [Onchocerca flexuosa]